jgi:hypothetical protein
MYGLKSLRGECHRINRRPEPFWLMVAIFSHYWYSRSRPEKASAIFCLKELK